MHTNDPTFTGHLDDQDPVAGGGMDDGDLPRRADGTPKGPLALAFAGAVIGALFAAVSTTDFMQHLDRQVHAIHCSFLPGGAKDIAESGCRTVMMSPYSSFFRESLWGGIPISLWALAVFAFLVYRTALLLWRGDATAGETKVLLAAAGLPVLTSVAYGAIAAHELDAMCKVCVGIYVGSGLCFAGALLAHRALCARDGRPRAAPFGLALVEGVGLVAAVTLAYLVLAPRPDPKTSMLGCGSLVRTEDFAGVMIPLAAKSGGAPSVEVLDPLCPSCKSFDARLEASSLGDRLDLKGLLFPLDSTCNWMVTEAIHPGACAVSEAVLCAGGVVSGPRNAEAAQAVLRWAFAHQADLRALGAKDESALRARIEREFPAVKGCLGSALVKSKLTKSLRWAVANAIPVLTPQLFVDGSRMCDEDTDLGLEYTLTRMLSPEAGEARAKKRASEPPPRRSPPPETAIALAPAAGELEDDGRDESEGRDEQRQTTVPARRAPQRAGPSAASGGDGAPSPVPAPSLLDPLELDEDSEPEPAPGDAAASPQPALPGSPAEVTQEEAQEEKEEAKP